MKPPLSTQRSLLRFVGVLLQCLDENKEPLPGTSASGFIRHEGERFFLYTCWHVVSGFDPNKVQIRQNYSKRCYLKVALQAVNHKHPEIEVVGGLQNFVIPLYDESSDPPRPLWFQDDRHIPNSDLNNVGLYVPFWHDVVKLELPFDLEASALQVIDESRIFLGNTTLIAPGDKCMIVGYPYGYSTFGPEQPTPVALTRFVASDRIAGRRQQFLLESIGAPGMSGSPVFIERENDLLLVGIYTGLIYPDYEQYSNNKETALGTVSDLTLVLGGALSLVSTPSEAERTA